MPFDWRSPAGLAFVIALMGWMPSAVDLSTWNSFWTLERIRTTGFKPTLRETLTEFNWGFGISVVLALGFLTMGSLLLHNGHHTARRQRRLRLWHRGALRGRHGRLERPDHGGCGLQRHVQHVHHGA